MRTAVSAPLALVAAAFLLPTASHAATFKTLHAFAAGSDGADPIGGMINVGGYLYGTTLGGGATNSGTVFKVSRKTGAETVVYSFGGNPDGRQPYAGLINIHGIPYGTTHLGGAGSYPSGTVFSIDPTTGAEAVLHSFSGGSGGSDGGEPAAPMINVHGILYGTTQIGGPENTGTVFTVNPATGAETILYTFNADNGDGFTPLGALLNVRGTLYGTTENGGAANRGTVFKVNRKTGAESVVYSFGGGSDGSAPSDALINFGGTLYGTTGGGGGTGCGGFGCGTVFSLDPGTGAEAVLYAFAGGSDGRSPYASLVNFGGTLYGTTYFGGNADGCGTVFSVEPSTGAEAILYAFTCLSDGANPWAPLTGRHGVLYGATYDGATGGTVFQLRP